MDAALWSTFSALLGAAVGGAISFLLNRQQFAMQLRMLQEQHKTEFMAETTARHFLSHKSFTDRSFEALRGSLGGFEEDELRRILVRAGAVRIYRDDGSEWWRLLSRMDEFIERKALERMAKDVIPAPPSVVAAPPSVVPAPPSVIPAPPSVIPAQAGIQGVEHGSLRQREGSAIAAPGSPPSRG